MCAGHVEQVKGLERPPARTGHATCAIREKLFVFGGSAEDGKLYNDLWIFDQDTLTWTHVTCFGHVPSPRRGEPAFARRRTVGSTHGAARPALASAPVVCCCSCAQERPCARRRTGGGCTSLAALTGSARSTTSCSWSWRSCRGRTYPCM